MSSPNRPKSASATGIMALRTEVNTSRQVPSPFVHNRSFSGGESTKRFEYFARTNEPRQQQSAPMLRTSGLVDQDLTNNAVGRTSCTPSIMNTSMLSGPGRSSLARRKSGGLRATLKRMFGSKRQPISAAECDADINFSDPGNLIASMRTTDTSNPSQTFAEPARPVTQSGSAEPNTSSQSFRDRVAGMTSSTQDLASHRRRNTLPSLVLTEGEAQNLSTSLDSYVDGQVEDEKDQGTTNTSAILQKRSRSAEALTHQRRGKLSAAGLRTDRATEIAYWRQSVLVDPLPAIPPHLITATESVDSDERHQPSLDRAPIKPLQSFDFGLSGGDGTSNLEDRVNTLEVKMVDFEYAIAKLQGVEFTQPTLSQPPTRKQSHDMYSASSQRSLSTDSSATDTSFADMIQQHQSLQGGTASAKSHDRSSKTETVRANPGSRVSKSSRRSAAASLRLTQDQLDSLKMLIQDERAARQQMEMQILDLQKEIEFLQTPVYADIRPLNYSMPSPRSYSHSSVSSKARRLHRSPPMKFKMAPSPETSRFSTESDAESEGGYEEIYQTPSSTRHIWDSVPNYSGVPLSVV